MPETTFGPEDGRRLPCLEGQERTEYTEKSSGLRLRVTRGGARTWALAYWSPAAKASRRLKLGDAARMPLSKARAAARAALHAVEGEGRDPAAERAAAGRLEREARQRRGEERRKASEERARRSMTFGALVRAYIEHRRTTPSGRRKRPARFNTLRSWASIVKLHFPEDLQRRPVSSITGDDFLEVLEGAVERSGATIGPRVRELLAAVWRWAEQRTRILRLALPAVSPLAGLPHVGDASNRRERALSAAEVWRLWRATEGEGLEGEALRLMLLTATRVREVTDLDRAELDLEAGVWNLPAARNKGGKDRAIPLSPQARALLRRVLPLTDGAAVFPGSRTRLFALVPRLHGAIGGKPWQARDLRRTAATLIARLGADPFVVALALGHARPDARMPAVTETYLRWNYDDKVRAALDRLGAWVEDTASRKSEPGDVVKIGGRR